MKLILEARHLFDGSVAVVAHKTTQSDTAVHGHHPGSADLSHPNSRHYDHAQHDATLTPTHAPGDIPALAPNPAATEILFIDPRVANWQALAKGVAKNVQIVLVDPNRDGLEQVTAALKGRSDLTAIQFLTYGQSGQIELGNAPITTATLASHAGEVASWGDHLAANADVEFWGCDVGQGDTGLAFVNSVHALTGAQVGASTDATGAAQLGGDWTLERTTGVLAVGAPFSTASMAAYQGVLDSPVPTVSFDPTTVPGDVLLGSTFTETVTFANTAANGVGYGPFIDLYVPKDSAQTATLTGASFLGTGITPEAVTLSTTIPGHLGVLGALHPLALDSAGQPLFVAAPPGYQANDVMYVLSLPFGSFTPGQPAAQIQLTFTLDSSTELSSMHGGQALDITAIGGFQYGADPLNDPGTDPSIRGTAGTAGVTSAADGMAVAASTVSLLDVSATTDLHESETATGPDYPFNYVLTIKPAPVTQGDPLSNTTFTFDLPPEVQYTHGTIAFTGPGGATGTATFNPGTAGASGPGGTVTVHFTSLGTDAGDTPTVVKIPVFVPQFDANGNPVLDAAGTPRDITVNTIYSYSGSWTPTAASVDHALGVQTISGDSSTNPSSTDFVAKALAIQVTDDAPTGNIVPGEVVTESIHFEVSDYYSLNQLKIADQLGDGLSLLSPTELGYVAPTLSVTRSGVMSAPISFGDAGNLVAASVNGQAVAESGSNAAWNYTRDDAGTSGNPGATTISFGVGALLEAQLGAGALASVLQGGGGGATQGVITFVTKVLDKYTNTNNEDSLREKDQIANQVTLGGTSASVVTVDNTAQTITATSGTVADDSAVTDSVAPGSMVLSVVAVNGQTTDLTHIEPGDTVTYGLTYSLTTGDYGALDLTANLPLPVFSTTDPTSTGSNVSAYTADNTADSFPTAGTYKLINPLSGESVVSATANGTANSISFNFGNRDDTTNAAGQKVTVYFSVVASDKPFADGLPLTSQGGSSYTNSEGQTAAIAAIQQVPLEEPEVTVKTGVVSVVGDGGASKGAFAPDTSNPNSAIPWTQQTDVTPSGAAGSPFAPAGTPAGTLFTTVGANGTANPLAADDLNVTGADGGDITRVVSTVDNEGHASAYDVTVQGTLPSGYSTGNVTNFAIYNSAGAQIDTGVTAAQYFSAGGVKLLSTAGTDVGIAAGDQVYVVYDLTLSTTQQTGDTLTAGSSVVNWASAVGGVAAGNGFVSGTGTAAQTLGEGSAALSDSATIGVSAPSVTKTVTSASDPDLPLGTDNAVVPGETVTYTVVLTLPQGVTSNGPSELTLTDQLPAGMTFGSISSTSFGTGVTSSNGEAVSAVVSGSTVTFDFGSSVTNSQVDTNGTITIVYTATVDSTDTPHGGATTYSNSAFLNYDSGQTTPVTAANTATVTEHDPQVTETITAADTTTGTAIATNGTVYSHEGLTYTVTLTNNGTAPANNLADLLDLPPGLTYVNGSLQHVSGGTNSTTSDSNTSALNIGLDTLAVGQTATFTFQATVNPNLPAATSLTVDTPADATSGTYYSLPGTAQGHKYSDSATDTATIGQITPVLSITGESNNTDTASTPTQTNTQTSTEATVGEVVTMQAYVEIPEGSNPTTLNFTMPSGLEYLNDGSAKIAFVSPNGDLVSTDSALSGVTQYQDINPGAANYISPSAITNTGAGTADVATFSPVDALPGSVVNAAGNSVSIDLGTLSNNDNSSTGNYVLVEFNAVVTNVAANHQGASALQTSFTVDGVTSNNVSVAVEEPAITITKTATAVDNTNDTVTYQVTVKNTGSSSAYNVVVDNPAATNETNIAFVSATGAGTGGAGAGGTTGTELNYAIGQLGAGGSEVITYTVKVAPGETVQNDTATAIWQSLAGQQTFNGSTAGVVGSVTGPRDSDSTANPPDNYIATAATDIGTTQGRVWQDLGNDKTTFSQTGGSADTALGGITVTATITQPGGTVIHETTTTASDGTYSFGALPDGTVAISLNGVPANETLVYDPDGSVSNSPPSASFTSAGDAHNNVDFSFQAPDTAPVIANWSGSATYAEGGPVVAMSGAGASVSDTQLDALGGDYSNTTLTLQRYSGGVAAPVNTDVFAGTGLLSLSGGTVTFNGVGVGTFAEANGKLSITFGAGATAATVNNVLGSLGYSSTDTSTVSTGIQIGATLDDHNTASAQGTGGNMTSAPAFVTVNEIPAPGGSSATFIEPNDSPAAAVAVAVDSTLSVASSDTFSGATVKISNFKPGEDVLVAGALPSGVTASFDAATGTMTLTGTNLSAATVQTALRSVSYYDSSDTPNTTVRDVTISVMDSTTNATTTAAVANIDVVATNDSPLLNGVPVTLNHATEDTGAPVGAVGTLVSALTGSGNVTDPDGANAHDGTPPGAIGVAITAANTTVGTWWYSTDNGASWTEFAGNGMTAVSEANALHLVADGNTRVYFDPTPDWNGSVPNALTFRAWDQFDGAANGSLSALPAVNTLGQGENTPGSAYSSASQSVDLIGDPVNDAPIASGSTTLTSSAEDTTAPPADTVGHLFGGNFSDSADQQQSAGNPSGSVANTLAGVAITANGADSSQGAWQYSTDNGTTWTSMPATGLSDSNSLVLSSSAQLRFVPAPDFNGVPGQLTTRLIDSSDTVVTGAVTGADLAAADTAIASVDVSGAHDGGATAVSAATVALDTTVAPVNDAPLASGSATLATNEDDGNPPGDTVGHLFGSNFNDSADQQQTVGNPTGSVANTLAGVAITGNSADSSQGAWQYSTDHGTSWSAIPTTGLSDSNSLVLSSSAELRFVPVTNYNGVPGQLTTRLIDSSTTIVAGSVTGADLATGDTAITGVDVSGAHKGGTTAVSAATVALGTPVAAINDAPLASGSATLAPASEDSNPSGDTVGHLFGGNFNDSADQQQSASNPTGSVANTLAGVAITGNAADASQGAWQYSTDNGAHWTAIAATGLSDSNSLVLSSAAQLRFVPAPDFNGVPGQLTTHLIDSSNTVVAGSMTGAELAAGDTAIAGVDVSGAHNGGTTAVSTVTVDLGTTVTAVNDAPLASGSASLAPSTEDATAPPVDTVGHLFGGNFNDSADQQQSADNPTGSVANTLAGVAITGNGADSSQGAWQYSTDNGAHWTTIAATGLSDSNSLVLSSSAQLRFVPAPDFNGVPGQLTTRLIDSSTTVVAGPVTGIDLAAGDTAISGVDVSGAHNGGTTSVSATTVELGTSVTAVNDAPVASGSATLGAVNSSDPNPQGSQVGNLFGGNFNDSADQQQSAANPTGSAGNPLAGIAITSNGATSAQGAWQYSSDGGKSWSNVPTSGLGDGDAIVLASSDSLRFKPSGGFSGTPGGLTVRLIDGSSGPVTDATDVDLGAVGATTRYSGATVSLSTQVTSTNRPFFTPALQLIPGYNTPDGYNTPGDPDSVDSQFPDDALVSPAEGRGHRSSLYGEPIIPQVWLTGSVGNHFVIEEQHAIIQVPSNLFDDTYPGASLEYDARAPGGGPLPQWLEFDSRNLTFTGTPPPGSHGTVEVEIVGRDQFGNQATATFQITVGRESHDLEQMLQRVSFKEPVAHAALPHAVRHTTTQQHPLPHARQHVQPHHAHVQPVAATGPHGATDATADTTMSAPVQMGRRAFSAQLREAGPIGKILQARQIVETIAEAAPVESR